MSKNPIIVAGNDPGALGVFHHKDATFMNIAKQL